MTFWELVADRPHYRQLPDFISSRPLWYHERAHWLFRVATDRFPVEDRAIMATLISVAF